MMVAEYKAGEYCRHSSPGEPWRNVEFIEEEGPGTCWVRALEDPGYLFVTRIESLSKLPMSIQRTSADDEGEIEITSRPPATPEDQQASRLISEVVDTRLHGVRMNYRFTPGERVSYLKHMETTQIVRFVRYLDQSRICEVETIEHDPPRIMFLDVSKISPLPVLQIDEIHNAPSYDPAVILPQEPASSLASPPESFLAPAGTEECGVCGAILEPMPEMQPDPDTMLTGLEVQMLAKAASFMVGDASAAMPTTAAGIEFSSASDWITIVQKLRKMEAFAQ